MASRRLSVLLSHVSSRTFVRYACRASSKLVKPQRRFSSNSAIVSNKVEVNGVRIHYERTGTGDHVVLLLPGALGSSRTDFAPQLEKMNKEKFTVICWDPRGYGQSIPPERTWPLEFFQRDADDAVGLIKKLGLTRVSLLGWSDGGITALKIAGQHPDLCRKLVIWGANAYSIEAELVFFKGMENIDQWSERMRQPFINVYGEEYFRKHWKAWTEAYTRYFTDKHGDICIDEVSKITCPTLIIHGQLDPLVVQEHPDYLHKTIKHSRLMNWPKAKHNLHLRYADDFNKTVEDFLLEE